jgi:hypothetical protein
MTEMKFSDSGAFLCNAGFNAVLVLPNGDVFVCSDVHEPRGNLLGGFTLSDHLYPCRERYCTCPFYENTELYKKAVTSCQPTLFEDHGFSYWEKTVKERPVFFRWGLLPQCGFAFTPPVAGEAWSLRLSARNHLGLADLTLSVRLDGVEQAAFSLAGPQAHDLEVVLHLADSRRYDVQMVLSHGVTDESGRALGAMFHRMELSSSHFRYGWNG